MGGKSGERFVKSHCVSSTPCPGSGSADHFTCYQDASGSRGNGDLKRNVKMHTMVWAVRGEYPLKLLWAVRRNTGTISMWPFKALLAFRVFLWATSDYSQLWALSESPWRRWWVRHATDMLCVPVLLWTAGGNHVALLPLTQLLAGIPKLLQRKQGKEPEARLPATIQKQFGTTNRWVPSKKSSSARQPLVEKDGNNPTQTHMIHELRTGLRAKMYKP